MQQEAAPHLETTRREVTRQMKKKINVWKLLISANQEDWWSCCVRYNDSEEKCFVKNELKSPSVTSKGKLGLRYNSAVCYCTINKLTHIINSKKTGFLSPENKTCQQWIPICWKLNKQCNQYCTIEEAVRTRIDNSILYETE